MEILIVDDEFYIIEGIMDGIDFAALGIDKIHTAQNAAEAKEILQTHNISIMITDIEMPGESGLELLSWVRANDYDIVTIFCTSYADFNYAKKAVEMRSFDYFLKPVVYADLQEKLRAAVDETNKTLSIREYEQHSKFWMTSQRGNKRGFWTDLLFGNEQPLSLMLKKADNMGLQYDKAACFSLSVFALTPNEEPLPEWKIYGFRNIAEEILPSSGMDPEVMIPTSDGVWLSVFLEAESLLQNSTEMCERLIAAANKYLECSLNCYFLGDLTFEAVREKHHLLKEAILDDVISENAVIDVSKYEFKHFEYKGEHTREWELLFSTQQEEKLLCSIDTYLNKLAEKKQLNFQFLRAMRLDMLQMILYSELNQNGINAQKLFEDEEYDSIYRASLNNVKSFKNYLHFSFKKALDYIRFSRESQSVVGKVKEYISSHLSENINRSVIAQQVFLNPDYLARVFKRETGLSIGAYLQNKRIHEAKLLLKQSNTQVNEIALKVGYDNFSYFSHVFREKTGMTPNEYRKGHTES